MIFSICDILDGTENETTSQLAHWRGGGDSTEALRSRLKHELNENPISDCAFASE